MNTFDIYQAFTFTTAKYPGAGASRPESIAYVNFGFGGETGETATAVVDCEHPFGLETVRAEFGDAGYYLARDAAEVGILFSVLLGEFNDVPRTEASTHEITYRRVLRYVGAMGRVLEVVKKKMRDGGGFEALSGLKSDAEAHEKYKFALMLAAKAWIDAIHECGFTVMSVLLANEAKLTSRKKRNVIHGEGDKR